ncbi:uncharacterized protein BXZ73DRAFT_51807 [Epithele typhae]|uniref:uncharacterized protein n=1 Tax=Epithele typhae TaxID=378194 RepID=UPI0020073145|nr:uncharacterized protein BXZ73DRAFT_51807 [Epithele typhae]KAH9921498.1 hypothetical protein BXZ73DRAFT_51807 [Epithele typhae]
MPKGPPPRNEAIDIAVKRKPVRLVDPETGALLPPAPLEDVLERVDRKTQHLELVELEPAPVVRIVNQKAAYGRTRERRVGKALGRKAEEKELQLTWSAAPGDIEVKLKKAHADLADGCRVTLVFAPKKGKWTDMSRTEQEEIVEGAVKQLEDVAKEWKPRQRQGYAMAAFLESLRGRKQVLDLEWAHEGKDGWDGLHLVESALRKGARVEAVFQLPSPPKKGASTLADPRAVDPAEVQDRFDKTIARLLELGSEFRPRDTHRSAVTVYLEGNRAT